MIVLPWFPAMLALQEILQQTLLRCLGYALDDISDEFIPFSDLKPRLNNYIFELCQHEWAEYPETKLHQILPKSAIFYSDIQLILFSFLCFISLCPFVAFLKATYAENSHVVLSESILKKPSFLPSCVFLICFLER